MVTTVNLTDRQWAMLETISRETGQSADDLVAEAVERLIQLYAQEERLTSLRQARGIWQDRTDLPSVETLRGEWERYSVSGE